MSRKLDSLVATKVMQWPVYNPGFDTGDRNLPHVQLMVDGCLEPRTPRCNKWSPSTDIAAAWEVVEKVGEVTITTLFGGGWCVDFLNGPEARADTAPMAICLAALRACGVSESQIAEATAC